MISCPIDIKDHQVVCNGCAIARITRGQAPETPGQRRRSKLGLQKYETYYRKLDLYYLSPRFDKIIDEDWLEQETQHALRRTIMQYLSKGKKATSPLPALRTDAAGWISV